MFLNVGGCSGLDRSVQIVYGTDGEGILQLEVYWKNVSIIPRTLKIAATTAIQTKFRSNSDEL